MKISVIIPCYNCSSNITKLLNGFPDGLEFEFILINDGSTDDTQYVIEQYISVSSKDISLLNIKNVGAAQARTVGLKKSSGDYIFFCDSDDAVYSENIKFYLNLIKSEKPDLLYFSSVMYLPNDNVTINKVSFNENIYFSNSDEFLVYQLRSEQYTSAVWTYIFNRDVLINSNAKFTIRNAHEDHFFTLSLISNSKKIFCCPKLLYIQNVTPGSLTNSIKSKVYLLSRLEAFVESLSLLNKDKFRLSRKLYSKWSLDAFLQLCKENKKSSLSVFTCLTFYKIMINNIKLISVYMMSKLISSLRTL